MDSLMDFAMLKDLMIMILKAIPTEIPMPTAISYWIHLVIQIKTRLGTHWLRRMETQTVTEMVTPKHLAIKMAIR